MKTDPPACTLRLMSECRVHTHYAIPAPMDGRKTPTMNRNRPVRIGSKVYESMTDAGRKLGLDRHGIRAMIREGKASFADPARKPGPRARAIIYLGKRYDGLYDAARRLGIGRAKLYALLDTGAAKRE